MFGVGRGERAGSTGIAHRLQKFMRMLYFVATLILNNRETRNATRSRIHECRAPHKNESSTKRNGNIFGLAGALMNDAGRVGDGRAEK